MIVGCRVLGFRRRLRFVDGLPQILTAIEEDLATLLSDWLGIQTPDSLSAAGKQLSEHMFITGFDGPGGRSTFFCGAAPSGCGNTTTAMAGAANA